MENIINELLVTAGPFQGQRFTVTSAGIRLGRSSSCEISIPDPSLSRNQCLFELRDNLFLRSSFVLVKCCATLARLRLVIFLLRQFFFCTRCGFAKFFPLGRRDDNLCK